MSNQEPQRRRRCRPSKRVVYSITVVGLLAVLCIDTGWSDVALNPWARSLTGDALLIGTWKGDLPVADGGHRQATARHVHLSGRALR